MSEHFLVVRGLGTRPLHLLFKRAVGQNLVGLCLLASPMDFEIAQHERSPAILFEKNKGIGREETGGVKHVRVILAGRDDETRFLLGFGHWFNSFALPVGGARSNGAAIVKGGSIRSAPRC